MAPRIMDVSVYCGGAVVLGTTECPKTSLLLLGQVVHRQIGEVRKLRIRLS